MSASGPFRLLTFCQQQTLRFQLNFPRCNYAKKDSGSENTTLFETHILS